MQKTGTANRESEFFRYRETDRTVVELIQNGINLKRMHRKLIPRHFVRSVVRGNVEGSQERFLDNAKNIRNDDSETISISSGYEKSGLHYAECTEFWKEVGCLPVLHFNRIFQTVEKNDYSVYRKIKVRERLRTNGKQRKRDFAVSLARRHYPM